MKKPEFIFLLGLLLTATPLFAQTTFHITEIGETLTTDIPGAIVSGGDTGFGYEQFQVDLPSSLQFSSTFFADIPLGEPDSPTTVNIVTPGRNNLLWLSEWGRNNLSPDQRDTVFPTILTFTGAVINVDADGNPVSVAGDLVVEDRVAGVPDAASTASLLLLSLLGLGAARRFRSI